MLSESYEQALNRSARQASAPPLPRECYEPWLCDTLGWTPDMLSRVDYAEAMTYLGWAEGKALAEWAVHSKPRSEIDPQKLAAVRAGRA